MRCSVQNCTNDTKRLTRGHGITFHMFPKEPNLRESWLQALGMTDWQLRDSRIVCSEHFHIEDLYETKKGQRKIRSGAVPVVTKNHADDHAQPAALRVCRVCLAIDVKMYDFTDYSLDEMYEQITGILICGEERLPQRVCWECAARLVSATHFKSRALASLELLQEMLIPDSYVITIGDIKSISRTHSELKSPLVQKIFDNDDCDLHIRDIFVKEKEERHDMEENEESTQVEREDCVPMSDVEVKDEDSNDEEAEHSDNDDDRALSDVDEDETEEMKEDPFENIIKNKCKQANAIHNDTERNIERDDFLPTSDAEVRDEDSNDEEAEYSDNDDEADNSDNDDVADDSANDDEADHTDNDDDEDEPKENKVKKMKGNPVDNTTKPKCEQDNAIHNIQERYKNNQRLGADLNQSLFTITSLSHEQQIEEMRKRQYSAEYINAPYKCTVCYRGYKHEASYNAHSIRHNEKCGAFECYVCKSRLKTKRELRRHLTARHREQYSCNGCGFITRHRGVANDHERWHAGAKYQCTLCEIEFEKRSTYLGHMRIKHVSDFVCELCGYTFVSQKGIDVHKQKKHRLIDKSMPLEGPYCSVCKVKFMSEEAHRRHFLSSSKHNSELDPYRLRNTFRSNYKKTKKRAELGIEGCPPINGKDTTREHGPKSPLNCDECGVQVLNLRSYAQHFRRAHPDKTRTRFPTQRSPYMCELCGNTFKEMTYLQAHMWVHTGEKRFKCDHCTKSFSQKVNLVDHMAVHSSKKSIHECPVCGKHFSTVSNRKRHMSIHSGVKPFQCDSCGKRSLTLAEQRVHIKHVHEKKPWPKRMRLRRSKKREASSEED